MLLCCLVTTNCVRDEVVCVCFQAEDGIRDLVRSRGLGDVYKRQALDRSMARRLPSGLIAMFTVSSGAVRELGVVVNLSLIHI